MYPYCIFCFSYAITRRVQMEHEFIVSASFSPVLLAIGLGSNVPILTGFTLEEWKLFSRMFPIQLSKEKVCLLLQQIATLKHQFFLHNSNLTPLEFLDLALASVFSLSYPLAV